MGRAKGNSSAIAMDGFDQAFGRHRGAKLSGVFSSSEGQASHAALELRSRWSSGDKEYVLKQLARHGENIEAFPYAQNVIEHIASMAVSANTTTDERMRQFLNDIGYHVRASEYVITRAGALHVKDGEADGVVTMLCGDRFAGKAERTRKGAWADDNTAKCSRCLAAANSSDNKELKDELKLPYHYPHFASNQSQESFLQAQVQGIIDAYNERFVNGRVINETAMVNLETTAQHQALVASLYSDYAHISDDHAELYHEKNAETKLKVLLNADDFATLEKAVDQLPAHWNAKGSMARHFYYRNLVKEEAFKELFDDWYASGSADNRLLYKQAQQMLSHFRFQGQARNDWERNQTPSRKPK